MQLHQPDVLAELTRLDARLLVLSFAPLARLKKWVPHFQTSFLAPWYTEQGFSLPDYPFIRTAFVADPALKVYHAYGLGQNKPEEVYSRKILRQYARWRAQGKPVVSPTEDPLQRGGNFVINQQNRLTLSHVGNDQSDRPTVSDILAAVSLTI